MTRVLPCGACGIEDHDVSFVLIEIAEDERREIAVLLPINSDAHAQMAPFPASERYASEPRCRDTRACAERVATYELAEGAVEPVTSAAPPPAHDPAEEGPTWLL